MAALSSAAPHIKNLSRERVWKEFSKLLAAPDPSESIMLMLKHSIMEHVLPKATNLAALCNLISYEHARKKPAPPNALLRLAALLTGRNLTADALKNRFALSTHEVQNLKNYLANPLVSGGRFETAQLSFCLYRYGFDFTQDFMVLAQAQSAQFNWESAVPVLEKWAPKTFPLKGEDILALGVPQGPKLGEILAVVERWWITQDFVPDHAACLAKAKEELGKRN